ncbi:BppU family phage baseplate upper protein [Clostridium perfringens]
MKEIKINVDSYNSDSINTIQGNNNAEVYKIYVLFNKRRIDLTGKTVKMAYLRTGTVEGDVINLNITNATEGEITLQITNSISKRDGVYSCQLAIYGADGFLEHTATFGLTVEANIFTKIAGEIADSKDFTYIERILEEAKTVSGDLKTNIPVAFNLNTSLESNINNANTVNQTLMATTEQSKVAATEATQKKSELESSLEETKKFIEGLDGSQNIPQIRMDVTELQNGLKSNQALSYEGSSISANNTLEGRTEGMKIKGRTLQNLFTTSVNNLALSDVSLDGNTFIVNPVNNRYPSMYDKNGKYKENTNYTVILDILENTLQSTSTSMTLNFGNASTESVLGSTLYRFDVSNGNKGRFIQNVKTIPDFSILTRNLGFKMYMNNNYTGGKLKFNIMVIETSMLGTKQIPSYFSGIKSFGESEQEGDKYKISILSNGKNLFDINKVKLVLFNSNGYIATENYNNTPSINLEPNTNYSIKFPEDAPDNKGFLFDRNGFKTREISQNTSQGYIFTTTNDEVGFSFYRGGGQITFKPSDINNYKIMLIEGTKTIDYEPYQCDKKDILIKEPLRSVGNISDVMYEDNGKVKIDKYVKEYTFTGDEKGWYSDNTPSGDVITKRFLFNLKGSLSTWGTTDKIICNNFIPIPNNYTSDIEGITIDGQLNLGIRIDKSKLNTPDVQGFKAWLKANPTTIVYQLAEPTTEIVENCVDIDLDTYQDVTYVNILNSLPGELDFKVPSNIGSSLQNLAKEVNNIWDVINNLLVPSIVKANGNIAMIKLNNNLK